MVPMPIGVNGYIYICDACICIAYARMATPTPVRHSVGRWARGAGPSPTDPRRVCTAAAPCPLRGSWTRPHTQPSWSATDYASPNVEAFKKMWKHLNVVI